VRRLETPVLLVEPDGPVIKREKGAGRHLSQTIGEISLKHHFSPHIHTLTLKNLLVNAENAIFRL